MSEINENATNTKDVIILGSGPAGLTAALYTARAFLSSLILTGMSLHGQAGSTDIIENYPGFPNGIGGSELGLLFQSQAERFGAEVVMDQAISVDLQKYPFIVKTYSSTYAAKSIIISTGATHKKLNVPGEKKFTGRGVSYCGTCDGWFYKDKDVIVVGGGDSALEEGIFLTRFTKSVTIIHRRDKLRAGAFLQKRAFANPKISFIWNSVVTELMGDDSLKVAKLKDVTTNEENLVSIDGVFIFIGNEPNHQLFEGQLELDEEGYIKVNRFMETSVPGVFAAGEIADPHFRQVITSAGMGAAAGIQATRYLEDLESDGP